MTLTTEEVRQAIYDYLLNKGLVVPGGPANISIRGDSYGTTANCTVLVSQHSKQTVDEVVKTTSDTPAQHHGW